MKRQINLIEGLLVESQQPLPVWSVAVVTGAAILVPVLVWGIQMRAQGRLDPQVTELRMTRDRLAQETSAARQHVAQLQGDNTRRLVERARADEIGWGEAFRELSLVVPSGVWLSLLETQEAAGESIAVDVPLRIQGTAFSQRAVADLLAQLETTRYFGRPELVYTQREAGQGTARVGFEIQCALRRTLLSIDPRRHA